MPDPFTRETATQRPSGPPDNRFRDITLPNLMEHLELRHVIGAIGAVIFYGRFYLQWYVSERRKRSVMPVAFWYMSACGSLILFAYGVFIHSPMGTLSHCFNIVVYNRNLVHIGRSKGALSKRRAHLLHGVAGIVVLIAISLLVLTWLHVIEKTPTESVAKTWFWIVVFTIGQGLFACRFLVQWLQTERRKKSVIPVSFWYFSIAAASLQLVAYAQAREWIYVFGMASTLPIYARNLWMIHRHVKVASEVAQPVD